MFHGVAFSSPICTHTGDWQLWLEIASDRHLKFLGILDSALDDFDREDQAPALNVSGPVSASDGSTAPNAGGASVPAASGPAINQSDSSAATHLLPSFLGMGDIDNPAMPGTEDEGKYFQDFKKFMETIAPKLDLKEGQTSFWLVGCIGEQKL